MRTVAQAVAAGAKVTMPRPGDVLGRSATDSSKIRSAIAGRWQRTCAISVPEEIKQGMAKMMAEHAPRTA